MSSSSTDRPGDAPRRGFLSVDRAALVRLAVAVAFGLAALLSPLVGWTSAQFTDSTQVSVTFTVAPTPTPTTSTPPPS
jgi:putative Mn2+ efflux pump MntP